MKKYFEIKKVEYLSKQTGQMKTMYKVSYVLNGVELEMTFKGDLHTLSIVNQLMNESCVGKYEVK
jgi:hypothetical protein